MVQSAGLEGLKEEQSMALCRFVLLPGGLWRWPGIGAGFFSSCMLNLYEGTFNFSAFQSLQCLELLCVDCSFQASPVMSPHKNICGKD